MLYNVIKVGDCMKDEVRTFVPNERTEEIIAYFDNKASKKVLEAFTESKISLNILKFQNMKKQLLKD